MDRIKMIAKLNEMCKKYDRKDYPGIAVGVVENGKLIFCKGYGQANLEYSIPIDENTVFHACSMTKQFTAACIALLIEEGKLSLDQDVSSFFPELKDCGEKVTIYNLLYMTNGIPDVYSTANFVCGIREDEGITRDEFWRYVTACDWKFFKPGDRWSYGNTGYFLLGQIIEAVTNKSLSQYADEHIFKPLGMNNTFIRDDRTKIIKNRAIGYSNYDHVHFNDSYKRYTSRNDELSINEENVEIGGAGQIWTTIKDLLLWDKNFYNNILGKGSEEFIKFLTTSGLLNNGKECGYGCGLFIQDFHGNKLVQHGGSAGGYSAYYVQLPGKKSSAVVLGNHTNFYSEYVDPENGLMVNILKLLTGYEVERKATEEKEADEANPCQMELDFDLSGEYLDQVSICIWNINKKNGIYYVKDSLGYSNKIFYYGKGVFKSADGEKNYTVVKNNKQTIECIKFEEGEVHREFYPIYREKVDASQLKIYEGSYCCEKLGVSYNVKIHNGKLYIRNENLHNNALDLYYTLAVNDTFICEYNEYIGNYCITFNRNLNNEIASFSYRDDAQTLRENFIFVKIK